MSTFATSIGGLQEGLIVINNAGDFFPVTSPVANYMLQSSGVNTYGNVAGITAAGPSANGNTLQMVIANPTTVNISPIVHAGTTSYVPSANVYTMNVTPVSASSVFQVDMNQSNTLNGTSGTGIIMTSSVFLNASTFLSNTQIDNGAATGVNFTALASTSVQFSTGTLTPFTVDFCIWMNNVSTSTALTPNDTFKLTEINNQTVSVSPMNSVCVSSSATPVQSFLLPSPAQFANTSYNGYQTYIDTANLVSSITTFFLVLQQPADPLTTAPTIAQSTVFVNSIATSPSLTFTPVVGGVIGDVVGIPGSTFICQNSITSVTA